MAKARGKGDVERRRKEEGERLLRAVPPGSRVGLLDIAGSPWTTVQLSQQMRAWLGSGQDVTLLVGGPEGLSGACQAASVFRWSLSPLTFPHALVRVLVAEQLFRAWSILQGHPYHRG